LQKIIVSVNADLVTDQRVQKVCQTLHEAGYEIFLIGRDLENDLPLERPYKTHRIRTFFNKGFFGLAEWNLRLFFKLLFTKKDILLSNDLDTLLANFWASKFSKIQLVYDTHELFTEIPELIHRPRIQSFWERIERYIFPKLNNVYTVCAGIAAYYQKKYTVTVSVVRNLPLLKPPPELSEFPFEMNDKKVVLYQGALNAGRGLELLIASMALLSDWILVIAGDGTITTSLKEEVMRKNLSEQVYFLGRLLPEDLAGLTPLANVGVSIEEDLGLSYHYALPNKLFDYIHANVPVLVSDLPEMRRIIENYQVGAILVERTPKELAQQLQYLAEKSKTEWDFKNVKNELNWQKESAQLLTIFHNLR